MQLYKPYEQKMLKLAEIKAKIMRYKYLILACLLLILAGISTLLYFKGNIRKDITLQSQYTYGDTITYDADAFMAKTKVVFYQNDQEVQTPKHPGTYTAQVVARGAFGIKKYGQTHTFTILPRLANVSLASYNNTYGETPSVRVDNLVYGDKVDKENIRFLYHDVLGIAPTVQVYPESFRILNEQGETVTDCYDFQDSVHTPKSILWTKRYISVATGSVKQVYDGTDVACEQYQITAGTLANGDTLHVTGFDALHGVGKRQNTAEFTVMNSDNVDVSKMYNVTKQFGTIEVTPKPLTISTGDNQKIFDGYPFDRPTYQVDGLIDGHIIQIFSHCQQTQSGRYSNFLTYDIQTQSGESVKDNYTITEAWGKLTIYAAKLVVTTNGQSTYNGREVTQFSPIFIEGGLLYEESFIITKVQAYDSAHQPVTIKDAGTYTVEIVAYEIHGQAENAPEYLVELQTGTHKVNKRPITVTLKDAEKYYDRTPLKSGAFVASNVVSGHSVKISNTGSITEPGKAENVLQGVEVYDENNQPVTKNYQITKNNGWLTVHKRKVTICPLPIVKTYDGQAIAYPVSLPDAMKAAASWTDKNDPLQDGAPLLDGDYIDFTKMVFENAIVDVGETNIRMQNGHIKYANHEKDNGKYYDVTVVSSKAIIHPLQIEIHSYSHEKLYDETPLKGTADDCYINKGALVGEDTITYQVNASQTQVGSCTNLIVEVVIKQGTKVVGYVRCDENGEIIQGNESTYNYQITVVHGTLTVQKNK